MAEPEKFDESVTEITDEMKEKLLLNLLGDTMNKVKPGPVSASTASGDQQTDSLGENAQTGTDAKDPSTIEDPNACGDGATNGPSESTEKEGASDNSKEDSKVDPLLELEEKLKLEEEGLSNEQLEDRHKSAQQLKSEANNFYKDGFYAEATAKYTEALAVCPLKETKSRSVLHANLAAALMGESKNKEALPHLDRALALDPDYFKALERRARLNKILENLDDALKDYEKLLELKPKHCEYMSNIRELQERIRIRNEEMKQKMMESLKTLGNVFLKPFGLSTDSFNLVPNEGGGYSVQMGGK